MKHAYKYLSFLLLSTFIALGTACGGSGGGGGGNDAEISEENKVALATAGTEGVKQAVNNSNSPTLFAKTNNNTPQQKVTLSLAQTVSQNPKLAMDQFFDCDFGTATLNIDGNTGNGSIVFTQCRIGFGSASGDYIEYNGDVTFNTNISGNIATSVITYNNFTFTTSIGGDVTTESLNLSATCTTNTDTSSSSCSYDSEALGIDGRTYEVSDISVSGNASSGYTISATITDPDNGIITITTTSPIILDCPNGQPGSGEIVVSDGSNTMIVTFIDCNSFSINFNGSTNTFNW
ncbi:MAG: hypothetical protein COA54_08690 [Thiotrichaceae bacterium]|nr:MAG: hypothetical protein COA54_08690 [Thiotrichaceae bacterium]